MYTARYHTFHIYFTSLAVAIVRKAYTSYWCCCYLHKLLFRDVGNVAWKLWSVYRAVCMWSWQQTNTCFVWFWNIHAFSIVISYIERLKAQMLWQQKCALFLSQPIKIKFLMRNPYSMSEYRNKARFFFPVWPKLHFIFVFAIVLSSFRWRFFFVRSFILFLLRTQKFVRNVNYVVRFVVLVFG